MREAMKLESSLIFSGLQRASSCALFMGQLMNFGLNSISGVYGCWWTRCKEEKESLFSLPPIHYITGELFFLTYSSVSSWGQCTAMHLGRACIRVFFFYIQIIFCHTNVFCLHCAMIATLLKELGYSIDRTSVTDLLAYMESFTVAQPIRFYHFFVFFTFTLIR